MKRDGDLELTALGQYFVFSLLFGESSCRTSLRIQVKGNPPAGEDIAAQSLKPVVSPSIALLHETSERIAPAKGSLTVLARCRVSREVGTVGSCVSDPKPSAEVAAAVNLRSRHMAFETEALSPGNPVPLYATLEFRFDAAQRLRVGVAADPLTSETVDWQDEFARVPIRTALVSPRPRSEYDSAAVTATCQIQADGSLLCLDFTVVPAEAGTTDDGFRARFETEMRDRLRYRRAAALLKNGAPSTGRWVSAESQMRHLRLRRD